MALQDNPPSKPTHRVSLGRTIKAVAWSFIGLRKHGEYQQDLQTLNPIHVIVVGILGALVLVTGLIALVHWIAG